MLKKITSKYTFVSLIGILGIPFFVTTLYLAFDGLSDGEHVNRVFDTGYSYSNTSIGLHMIFGVAVTALAPLQLLMGWTRKWMKAHRIIGYIFSAAAFMTSFGGLIYIMIHGTTGGTHMDIPFAIYGILLLIATFQTIRFARAKKIKIHNEWALRLFVLAVGSWFYRVCYGFWFTFHPDLSGHTNTFDGSFDLVMNWGFFVAPLVLLEIYFFLNKQGKFNVHPILGSSSVFAVSLILITGTWWIFSKIIAHLI